MNEKIKVEAILNSSLNKAHLERRKAEAHLDCRRFEEAILCHKKAVENLDEAVKHTNFPKVLESLHLQRDFHIRQQNIVKFKKTQLEMFKKKAANQLKSRPVKRMGGHPSTEPSSDLPTRIYRKMDEADSLLEILCRHELESDNDYLENEESRPEIIDHVEEEIVGSKQPKNEHVVIEELRTLNNQLRSLVVQLIDQLEIKEKETQRLQERVRILTFEKEQLHTDTNPPRKHSLHVITDSVGNCSSPFVLSPCGDLSPDVLENRVIEDLPPLAPLELPNFDFAAFTETTNQMEKLTMQ